MGRRVALVGAVDEQHTGLAVEPSQIDNLIEHLPGFELPDRFTGGRFDQVIAAVDFERLHEHIGQGNAEIEVVELVLILLGGDEIENVGMVDAQHPHIGAAALAALFDGLGGGIEDSGERERSRGDPLG